MQALQRDLLRLGQFIPEVVVKDPVDDLAQSARIRATQRTAPVIAASRRPTACHWSNPGRRLLPVQPGPMPRLTFPATVTAPTTLRVELRTSDRPTNHTPDVLLATQEIALSPAEHTEIRLDFDVTIDEPRYVFVCFQPEP